MISIDKAVAAKITKNNKQFEILVDPEAAKKAKEDLKKGKDIFVADVLAVQDIFEDYKKGKRVSKSELEIAFETKSIEEAAKIIIRDGVIHTTSEQRDKEKQDKFDRIAALISNNAIDSKTKLPIPRKTIEDALNRIKFHVDNRKVEDQLPEAIKELRKVIPLGFHEKTIELKNVAPNLAEQCLRICKNLGTISKQNWNPDKSWTATVAIPAGLREEFIDKINQATKGKIDMKLID